MICSQLSVRLAPSRARADFVRVCGPRLRCGRPPVRSLAAPLLPSARGHCLPRRQYGNVSRFVNHACGSAANLRCWLECGRRRVVLYPTRPIRPGEELTFDYGLFSEGAKTPGQSER